MFLALGLCLWYLSELMTPKDGFVNVKVSHIGSENDLLPAHMVIELVFGEKLSLNFNPASTTIFYLPNA